jgi:hypothetical protein
MQLQVECNGTGKHHDCWTCDRSFEVHSARVLIYNNHGKNYGEVCPQCLDRGFEWLSHRFEQLSQPQVVEVG